MNDISCLIISSTLDYSTDLVCLELERRGIEYLRINRDKFNSYDVSFNVNNKELYICIGDNEYQITNEALKSIYFRAPVFIRSHKHYSVEDQLSRSQWSSFIRNMIIFEKAVWVNNPVDVYRAENKMFQLSMAMDQGLLIPETMVANITDKVKKGNRYVVKALDTPLFYEEEKEYFTYTSIISGEDLVTENLQIAPVFIQDYIEDKTDIRTTIVGNQIYSVKILVKGMPAKGDWRENKKEDLTYVPVTLPDTIEKQLYDLMRSLNLKFGGVDLAKSKDKYYFIEVNPTGEWGWLVKTAKLPIDKAIVDILGNR